MTGMELFLSSWSPVPVEETGKMRAAKSPFFPWAGSLLALVCCAATARPQSIQTPVDPRVSSIIIPQRRAFPVHPGASVEITAVKAGVVIVEQAATTTMDISLRNPGSRRLEAELLVPVPDGCVVRGFTFQGAAKEPTARLLRREEARRVYDSIVRRVRDPALLEFAGYNLIRSSVFPVEARGVQKVRLTYEHILPADGNRVDFVLPRSESLDYSVPWKVSVKIRSKRPVSTVYSPSHEVETIRKGPGEITARIVAASERSPGAFRLSYLLEQDGITASLLPYPDPKVGGGYFLLLAGLPATTAKKADGPAIKREVTLVLDRSGSMNGEKLRQVREAAMQIIAGLEEGEAFNVITYNEAVEMFSAGPVVKSEENEKKARVYLQGLRARGGTNIHDALVEALRQKPSEGRLPIVLFLTDGLPTIGQTSEVAIREVAKKGNPYSRRVFTFGVGVDVNTPLLERIASLTRAVATFVLPREDVEVKVGGVFRRLTGPVLAAPRLAVLDRGGNPAPSRVRDLAPTDLPDLFEGDQLVLLGRYQGQEPLHFELGGNYLGKEKKFRFDFHLNSATTRNAFVPRLWASRKIAFLEDAIRDLGATAGLATNTPAPTDPRLKELVDEIVRLSTEFGVLSEYTAFLAHEGTDLSRKDLVLAEANDNFLRRALRTRSGVSSLNQDLNRQSQKAQKVLNFGNVYWDRDMKRASVSGVQQMADKAFYFRGGRWVDSRVVETEKRIKPDRVIDFSSAEFMSLVHRLAARGRQGYVSLRGDILMELDGEHILVRGLGGSSRRGSR